MMKKAKNHYGVCIPIGVIKNFLGQIIQNFNRY